MEKETTATEPPKNAPPERQRDFDWVSTLSFGLVSVLGIASIINSIHVTFNNKFVRGTDITPLTDIYNKYYSKKKIQSGEMEGLFEGIIPRIAKECANGSLKWAEYIGKRNEESRNFHQEVYTVLEETHQIASKNVFARWTIGTWDRFKALNVDVRTGSAIGFATVTALGIGAVALLKHSKNTIDRIEEKLDQAHIAETARGR